MQSKNRGIQKFIQILEKYKNGCVEKFPVSYEKGYSKGLINCTLFFDKALEFLNGCSKDSFNIFNSFYSLSLVLESANFSDSEIFDIVFCFLEKNIHMGLLQSNSFENIIIDAQKYNRIKVLCKHKGVDNVDVFIEQLHKKHQSGEEMNLLEETCFELVFGDKNYFDNMVCATATIYESYFCKKDSYIEGDIHNVIKALRKLEVSDSICSSIESYLIVKQKERSVNVRVNDCCTQSLKNEDSIIPIKIKMSETKGIRTTITNKEYIEILRKIEKVVDLTTLKLKKKYLSFDEQEDIAGQLLVLGKSRDEVRKFIKSCNPFYESVEEGHFPISLYQFVQYYEENYSRYLYYKDICGLEGYLDDINTYIEFLREESDMDKFTLFIEIYNNIKEMESFIPKTYEYELKLAEKVKSKILAGGDKQ